MPESHLTTQPKSLFISERPIFWQAYLDIREFSRTQVVPASVMAVAAFIAALITGQVTSVSSALLFIVCSVAAGVVFYFLIAIVRAPFIVIGQHHRQLSDLQQKLIEVEARSFRDPSPVPLALPEAHVQFPAQIAATSFEFTNYVIVDRWPEKYGSGLADEKPDNIVEVEGLRVQVMLARFYYKPELDLPGISVKAHLAIADLRGAPLQPRYDAVWDQNSEGEYKYFSTADTHALVIGVLPTEAGQGLTMYQYGFKFGRGFSPTFETLPGNEFVLQLELIGKVNYVTVLKAPMRFLLTLEPPSLEFLGY